MPHPKILLGWTTVDSAHQAKVLAAGLIAARLAACVQIDGPVTSHYIWKGKPTRAKEWRLWIKFLPRHTRVIEQWLHANHPYSTPQWLAVEADEVSKSYFNWMLENTGGAKARKKR
jgi:periplasmic divalent cation tolerance protein